MNDASFEVRLAQRLRRRRRQRFAIVWGAIALGGAAAAFSLTRLIEAATHAQGLDVAAAIGAVAIIAATAALVGRSFDGR